jgi:uncharacterized protein involved in exopolysaccharide biosynthesis
MTMDIEIWKRALRQHGWIAAAAGIFGLVFALLMSRKGGTYFAESQVLLVNPTAGQFQAINDTAHLSVRTEDLPALAQSTSVVSNLARAIHFNGRLSALRPRIRVRVAEGSSMMPITFSAANEREAVAGANALADALTSYDRKVTTSRFDRLVDDLRGQIRRSSRTLADLDHQIASITAEHPLLSGPKDGGAPLTSRIIDLEGKRDDANALLQGDQEVANGLAALINSTRPLANEELSDSDQVYSQLKAQYAADAAHLAFIQKQYSGRYPGLPELLHQQRNEIAQLNRRRAKAISRSPLFSKTYSGIYTQKAGADAKVASDQAVITAYNQRLHEQQQQLLSSTGESTGLAELRREHDAEDAAYALLANRLTSAIADRSEAASLGSIAVIDRADTASRATWSTSKLIAFAGFLCALFIGLGIAYLLEAYSGRLDGPEKIIKLYGAPVYATVGK